MESPGFSQFGSTKGCRIRGGEFSQIAIHVTIIYVHTYNRRIPKFWISIYLVGGNEVSIVAFILKTEDVVEDEVCVVSD